MKVQVFQIFFKAGEYGLVPADSILYSLAMAYAEEKLANPPDLSAFKNIWVACEVDDDGVPKRAHGLLGMSLRADFTLCRFTDNAAVVKLVQRANDHLHDTYNARGNYALVHIPKDELPEQRCTDYQEWMKLFELEPADRWAIKVR